MIKIDAEKAREAMREVIEDIAQTVLTRAVEILKEKGDNTGFLARSGELRREGDGMWVEFTAPYAWFVEFGASPHMPPIEPIILWARRKMKIRSKKKQIQVAWKVAKSIEREGTKGKKFLGSAVEEARQRWS